MNWLVLLLAGLVEVAWSQSIKPTHNFTRPIPTLICLALMAAAVWLLSQAMNTLPVGTAYAVFTGIGAVGTVTVGILVGGDPATPGRILPIVLIVAGVIALRLFGET